MPPDRANIYGGNKRKDRPEGGLYVREEDTSKCLDAANGLNPTCSQGGTAVVAPMAVRRLTPVECERLQGFPDNWSRISWKGKPETNAPTAPATRLAATRWPSQSCDGSANASPQPTRNTSPMPDPSHRPYKPMTIIRPARQAASLVALPLELRLHPALRRQRPPLAL
jgi:hypothetical protein